MKLKVEKTVKHHFKSVYKEGDITKGKNLIRNVNGTVCIGEIPCPP